MRRFIFTLPMSAALSLIVASICSANPTHLMRYADVHQDKVVFTYEGDLWLVSTSGGSAYRITRDPGIEQFAKFSPDGTRIAFTANYDGGNDVYVMDTDGGVPKRLTFHPAGNMVLDWFPDGQSILFRSRRNYPFRGEQIFQVSVNGGPEHQLPVDRAGLTAISPDGKSIAYNRISTEFRTWKRYQGGMAPCIWMGSLATGDFQKITDWKGTNSYPMWEGEAIYYLSDAQHGTLNIFKYDIASKQATALTSYTDYDVKYPSIGPGQIIFQYAESLHLLDLKTGAVRKLDITIPTDRTAVREGLIDANSHFGGFSLSPSGHRALLECRGEVLNYPADDGESLNLTHATISREKNAAWSPDGRSVVFISDKSGEEELYISNQHGQGPWRQLTKDGHGFRMQPAWSPDSKWIIFGDKALRLNMVSADGGETICVDKGDYDDCWERWGIMDYAWSPDSKWIAYTKVEENINETIQLYSLDKKKHYAVTDDMSTSVSPSFDPQGRYLYFLSKRTYAPIMSSIDHNHAFMDMWRPYVVILQKGAPSPFEPKDSSEPAADAKKETSSAPAKDSKATHIDLDDLEGRTVVAEGIPAGNYFRLEATDKGFCYLKKESPEFLKYQTVTDVTPAKLDLMDYDLEKKPGKSREAKKLITGINNYHFSADGKKLIYRSGETFGVVDAHSEAKVGDGKIELAKLKFSVDRLVEYTQIYNEAWRVQRDFFYDKNMHGLDWAAVGAMYRKFIPDCGNRTDLNYLIGEMISELNAGHTYISDGDFLDRPKKISTGLLGADFDEPKGAGFHRICHIVPGVNWDDGYRSPLCAPGCGIKEGDYLIAIDGEDVPSDHCVYEYLQDKADRWVELSHNSKPQKDGAKICRVRTISSENAIRYHEWVARNRAIVDKASNGQIGYLHLPDMGEPGLIEFAKAYYPLHTKKAIIIDERYNGGGFVGDMIIDRLERKLWAMTQPREGKFSRNPEGVFRGHLAVLINEDTGSNGEYFAQAIKLKGIAKLIGMRTWGGAVGIEAHEILVDGGTTTPPQFAPYGLARTWLVEGHGVDPDIQVQNMPHDVLTGKDAQLETALRYLTDKISTEPMEIPPPPAYPRRARPAGSDERPPASEHTSQ